MALLTPNTTYLMNGVTINEKIIPDGTRWKDATKAAKAGFSANALYKKQQKLNGGTGKAGSVTIHNTNDLANVYDDAEQYTRATHNENMGSARVHFYTDDTGAWQNLKAGTGLCKDDPVGSAEVSWHSGDGSVSDGGNMTSLSIEIIMNETPEHDAKAYDNGARIAAWLLWKHGLTINDLVTHTYWVNKSAGKTFADVDQQCTNPISGKKWCPSYIFASNSAATALKNWMAFKSTVRAYLDDLNGGGVTAAPKPENSATGGTAANLDGFIAHLEQEVKNGSIYVWGAQGQGPETITEAWIRKMETSEANANRAIKLFKQRVSEGYGDTLRAFDCSGLGMAFLQNETGISKGDMSANTMMGKCEIITKAQMCRGCWVFKVDSSGKATHIGYVVDDALNVIEAKGRDYGVIKSPMSKGGWNRYGIPSYFKGEITKTSTTAPETGLTVGMEVDFTGTKHYTSSYAKATGKTCKPGKAKITDIAPGKPHPYHCVALSGTGATVHGWVDAADVSPIAEKIIKKGDKVKVLKAKTYTGGTFKTYYDTYDVIQVNGDRVVIGIGKTVTAAVHKDNLQPV